MKDGKFEAADFRIKYIQNGVTSIKVFEAYAAQAAEDANLQLPQLKAQWLEELLRDAPVVTGRNLMYTDWHWGPHEFDTHTAKLIAIEEIGK